MFDDLPTPKNGDIRGRELRQRLERALATEDDLALEVAWRERDAARATTLLAQPLHAALGRGAGRKAVVAAIMAQLLDIDARHSRTHLRIAEAGGFRFEVLAEREGAILNVTPWLASVAADGDHTYAGYDHEFRCDADSNPAIIIAAFESLLRDIIEELPHWQAALTAARSDVATAQRSLQAYTARMLRRSRLLSGQASEFLHAQTAQAS